MSFGNTLRKFAGTVRAKNPLHGKDISAASDDELRRKFNFWHSMLPKASGFPSFRSVLMAMMLSVSICFPICALTGSALGMLLAFPAFGLHQAAEWGVEKLALRRLNNKIFPEMGRRMAVASAAKAPDAVPGALQNVAAIAQDFHNGVTGCKPMKALRYKSSAAATMDGPA